jgi:tetratricopeptide (TPR) repeat protein/predicted Ser/Thr protein kinase
MSIDPLDRIKGFFGETPEEAARPRIGKYEILREIARGGMAVVYEARDPALGRKVALKVLKEGNRERVHREASAAAKLRHPNVVAIYDVGPDFIAMDLIEGRTLAEAAGGLTRDQRLAILETVARAVAHAHSQGVIHRDLKPQNILIDADGRVVLTDFGLARIEGGEDLTRTGAVFGTPHYMAPEQVQGTGSSSATDVWALGVLLQEALSGMRPFEGATPLALYDRIVRADPPPLPGDLGAIAARALEKNPAHRYPDAAAFAEDLANARRGAPVSVRPQGPLGRAARRLGRHPVRAAAVLGAAAVTLFLGMLLRHEHERALQRLREKARISLEAALDLRRAGAIAQMRKSLAPLEEACREAGDTPETDYLLGRLHRALLEDAKALECQERALSKDPRYTPARYERAVLVALRDGRPGFEEERKGPDGWRASVLEDARRALEVEPPAERATPAVARGLVAYAEGRLPAAGQAFSTALEQDPLLEEARELLGLVIRSEMLPGYEKSETRFVEAERLLTQGIQRDRGYLPHYVGRAELRWSRGSRRRHRGFDPMPDYRAAEEDCSEALKVDPLAVRALQFRGQVRVYRGIWALETDQDPSAAWDAAEADLAKALSLQPAFSGNWLWRGNCHFYRGFWKAGRGRDPLADFEAGEKDLSEAVARAVEPSNELRWRGRLRAQHAAAKSRTGQDALWLFDLAEADFAAIPAKYTGDAWFWTWRSTVSSERALARITRSEDPLADFRKAEEQLAKSLDLDRESMEAWKHRGFLRWQRAGYRLSAGDRAGAREDYAAAAADFLEALSINPTLKFQIGDRAEIARRKAAELDPKK